MVGQFIKESETINQQFNCRYINLLASREVNETGKITLSKITGFLAIWFKLLTELVRNRPGLCYLAITSTGAAFYRDLMLVALLKLFGVKRVYHMHNKGVSRVSGNALQRMLYRFVFNGSEVILLSGYLYEDIQSFVPEKNVHICPNGIPDECGKPEAESLKLNDEENDPIQILFLSNLIESKGVFVLLEACAMLKDRDVPFEAVFIGGEGDITASRFQEKAGELGISNQAKYVGKKYDREKFEAFAAADIFSFPTYYPKECFPLVLLEAMQFSLPIVTTPEGGISDMVKDGKNGFLVDQHDSEALADKLEYLISNEDVRRGMGKAGRKRYERKFTIQQFEQRMAEILEKVSAKN